MTEGIWNIPITTLLPVLVPQPTTIHKTLTASLSSSCSFNIWGAPTWQMPHVVNLRSHEWQPRIPAVFNISAVNQSVPLVETHWNHGQTPLLPSLVCTDSKWTSFQSTFSPPLPFASPTTLYPLLVKFSSGLLYTSKHLFIFLALLPSLLNRKKRHVSRIMLLSSPTSLINLSRWTNWKIMWTRTNDVSVSSWRHFHVQNAYWLTDKKSFLADD